jgi:hypothetical protein
VECLIQPEVYSELLLLVTKGNARAVARSTINDSDEFGLLQCCDCTALRILVDTPGSQVRGRQRHLFATLKIGTVADR